MASSDQQELSYSTPQWWKEAIVYQVYPSSFQSHQGATTGWGSIKGITSRLDYLKSLGINVVWSSPFFKSPQADMGYDIADYKDIDNKYGTLEDVDDLISGLRERDMKLVVDLVVNHTSSQHSWFLESRSSKDNPKRDWYIWRRPKQSTGGGAEGYREPPNNWAQILGEANSAWKYDPVTDEYYLCLFTPEQPDLNWENPEVRAAIWDIMHFWLKRGASGFRLDVINMISKVPGYPDADIILDPRDHKYQPALKYVVNGPKLHDYLQEMHREVLSKYNAITVGEMPGVSDENEILKTVGANAGELRMIFIFDLVDIDKPTVRMALKPWDLKEMKAIVTRWQRIMIEKNGWNSVFIENHDNPRSVSRYTDDSDQNRHIGAKLLALMQTTLGGTLFVYQGEELGMRNVPRSWDIEEYKDIETINYWDKVKKIYANDPERLQHGRAVIEMKARDHARTPMQWDASPNAGFCDANVTPWMRVNDDYTTINVGAQMKDDGANADLTVLRFWQQSIRRRKEHASVFVYGGFEELTPEHPNVFAYLRTSATGEKWLVVLNYFGRQVEWHMPSGLNVEAWVCGSYGRGQVGKPRKGMVPLKPWEGLLAKCV
ncbi:glycoside hydrolase family 13 protein [Xylaria longipes]|nr:glycoside hydrolase family 13 protein [Xylaria longipes]